MNRMMVNMIVIAVALGAFLLSAACTQSGPGSLESHESHTPAALLETDLGNILIAFEPEVAPKTVENFKSLLVKGFYDGTYFHRVIPGFMIQGGDPNTRDTNRANDGTGGPGYSIKAEFSSKPHVRGTVSMARSQNPDSAGSQFFICVARTSHLDGQYTVFGRVLEGMDVVDKIVNTPRDRRDNPIKSVYIRKASLK